MKIRHYISSYNHWLIALVLCAVIVAPTSVLFPHTFGKTLFFVIALAIIAPLILFGQKQIQIPRNHITIALSLFIVSMIVSTIFSVDSSQSLWGTDTRGFGLWVWVWMWILYILLSNILKHQNKKRFLTWLIIMLGNTALLKVISEVVTFGYQHRAESFFGNPLLYANVALFPLFFALERFFAESDTRWKTVALISAMASGAGIYLTQTRGVIVGLGVAVIAIIAYGFRPKTRKQKKRLALASIATVIIIAGLWTIRDTRTIRQFKALNRILNISLSESSANQRLILWKSGFKAAQEKPLLGWGPETYDYAFNKHFDPIFTRFGFNQTYSDRAHNMYVDALIMQGILGLLIFLFLLFAMFRSIVKKSDNTDKINVVLLALLVAYAVQAIFSFDSPATAILFMFFAAYLTARSNNRSISARGAGLAIICVMISIPTLYVASQAIASSQAIMTIEHRSDIGQPEIQLAKTTLEKWSPHQNSLTQRYVNLTFERSNRDDAHKANILLQSGIDEINKGIERSPEKFEYHFTLGNLLTKAGYIIDPSFTDSAETALTRALSLSPNRVAVLFQNANLYVLTKEYDKAVEVLNRAVALGPDLSQSHYLKGLILTYTEKKDEGLDSLATAIHMENPYLSTNVPELQQIARVAVERERVDILTYVFVRLIRMDPLTEENWYNMEQLMNLDGVEKPPVRDVMQYLQEQGYNRNHDYAAVRAKATEFLEQYKLEN